ncbi:MAG: hypothetical protein ACFFDN_36135 [Candidatus Hodarchaeota archaeon]
MNKWKHILDFKYFWDSDSLSVKEKADLAIKELDKLLKHFKNDEDAFYELEEIIEDFKNVSGDGTSEFTITEDFDSRMYDLYNWADYNRVWVKTLF